MTVVSFFILHYIFWDFISFLYLGLTINLKHFAIFLSKLNFIF